MTLRRFIEKQSVLYPDHGILLGTKQEILHQAIERIWRKLQMYYYMKTDNLKRLALGMIPTTGHSGKGNIMEPVKGSLGSRARGGEGE